MRPGWTQDLTDEAFILDTSSDPDVYLKYIQAAVEVGNLQEAQRVIELNYVYNPVEVLLYLGQKEIADPNPFIALCDLHGYIDELVSYLFRHQLWRHVTVYATQVAPEQRPAVVSTLEHLGCQPDFITALLGSDCWSQVGSIM